MSHFVNANPLNYDAKYPQTCDAHTNDEAKIAVMEQNIGLEIMFQIEGQQFYGKIIGVPNSEHYSVLVGEYWNWYVREDAIHFVKDISKKI